MSMFERHISIPEKQTGFMLESIARGVTREQEYRELVRNELDAGAARVVVDFFPEGKRKFVRVSGDGRGMTPGHLGERMATLFDPESDDHFGVGARLATWANNPSGVDWVSRTAEGEAMVRMQRNAKREAVLAGWEVDRNDAGPVYSTVVEPDGDELKWAKETGTAVILRGQGRSTWRSDGAHGIARYLSMRFYSFGNATVHVLGWANGGDPKQGVQRVAPLGELLERHKQSAGEIVVDDARIRWWVLSPRRDRPGRHGLGGASLLLENEMPEKESARRTRLAQFGIFGREALHRVVLLVEPSSGVVWDVQRDRLVGHDGEKLPWSEWVQAFRENMPNEIRELLPTASIGQQSLRQMVSDYYFGENWHKRLKNEGRLVLLAKASQNGHGGDTPPDSVLTGVKREPDAPRPDSAPAKQRRPRRRAANTDGQQATRRGRRPEYPEMVWVSDDEWNHQTGTAFAYEPDANIIFGNRDHRIVQGYFDHHLRNWPNLDEPTMRAHIEAGFHVELGGKILHAYDHLGHEGWDEGTFRKATDPLTLTVCAMGFHTLDGWITQKAEESAKKQGEVL